MMFKVDVRISALLALVGIGVALVGCGGGGTSGVAHIPPQDIGEGNVPGQGTLVSYQSLESMTADQLTSFMQTTLGSSLGDPRFGTLPDAVDGMDLYCFLYSSLDFYGNLVILSGAVSLPTNGSPKGLVIYTHGTAIGQHECPSSGISGSDAYPEAEIAVAAFASGGYAVVMPDYIGQGSSKAVHPYVMPAKNAIAARDSAIAAYTIAEQLNRSMGTNIYVTGYSEGGANAMGLCQLLEQAPIAEKNYVAAATMSGPYDISGAQRIMLMGPQQPFADDLQFAPLLLTGDIIHSANAYFDIKPSTVFKTEFADQIATAFSGAKTGKEAAEQLILAGTLAGYKKDSDGDYHLADIMLPAAAAALTTPDPTNPLYQYLNANNTFDWAPTIPIYMVGLTTDTLVSFGNTQSAIAAMRARGVSPATVNYHGIIGPDLNHITTAPGASILARHFIDGGFSAVPLDPDVP